MALPTNFLSLPVETGLEILRQLNYPELLKVVASVPEVYLRYRSFLLELGSSKSNYLVVQTCEVTPPYTKLRTPIRQIGIFNSREAARQATIKFIEQEGGRFEDEKQTYLSVFPTDYDIDRHFSMIYGIYIIEIPS